MIYGGNEMKKQYLHPVASLQRICAEDVLTGSAPNVEAQDLGAIHSHSWNNLPNIPTINS
jgi:hypothetical protein